MPGRQLAVYSRGALQRRRGRGGEEEEERTGVNLEIKQPQHRVVGNNEFNSQWVSIESPTTLS